MYKILIHSHQADKTVEAEPGACLLDVLRGVTGEDTYSMRRTRTVRKMPRDGSGPYAYRAGKKAFDG